MSDESAGISPRIMENQKKNFLHLAKAHFTIDELMRQRNGWCTINQNSVTKMWNKIRRSLGQQVHLINRALIKAKRREMCEHQWNHLERIFTRLIAGVNSRGNYVRFDKSCEFVFFIVVGCFNKCALAKFFVQKKKNKMRWWSDALAAKWQMFWEIFASGCMAHESESRARAA